MEVHARQAQAGNRGPPHGATEVRGPLERPSLRTDEDQAVTSGHREAVEVVLDLLQQMGRHTALTQSSRGLWGPNEPDASGEL